MSADRAEDLLVFYFKRAWEAAGRNWDADNAQEVRSIVDGILAAAQPAAAPVPDGSWLTCVDRIHGTGPYALNPRHVLYIDRSPDGWWQAVAVGGRTHRISVEDDAKVQALMSGGAS